MKVVRRVVRGSGTPFIGSVFADQQLSLQRMMFRRESDGVAIPISPGIRLYSILRRLRIETGTQDRSVAHARIACTSEGLHRRSRLLDAKFRIPARLDPATGVEHVLAQNDVLAGNIRLVGAATVVTPNDTAVGGGAL